MPNPVSQTSTTTSSTHYRSFDGDQFGYLKWLPKREATKVIIGTHGICGVAEDFEKLAEFLQKNAEDIAVYAYNTRSQGMDPIQERRGDISNPKDWHRDLYAFTRLVRSKHPKAEIIWFGESMGTIITLNAFNEKPTQEKGCDKIILSAPVIDIKSQLKWWQIAGLNVASFIAPHYRIPLDKLAGGNSFEITKGYNHNDEESQQESYFVKSFTIRFLNIFGKEIEKMETAITQVDKPIALFHGGKDFFSNKAQMENFITKAPSNTQIQLFHFPEAYHLMLYDAEREKIFTQMLNWINQ